MKKNDLIAYRLMKELNHAKDILVNRKTRDEYDRDPHRCSEPGYKYGKRVWKSSLI